MRPALLLDRKRALRLLLLAVSMATIAGAAWRYWSGGAWTDYEHGELPASGDYADITFSHDGRRLAYVSRTDSTAHVVLDGHAQRAFDSVSELIFLRDGRLVYRARLDDKWLIMDNGRAGEEFDELGEIAVNPSRSAYAVARRVKDAWTVGDEDGVLIERVASAPTALALGEDRFCAAAVKEGELSSVVTSAGQRFGPFDYVGELSVATNRKVPRFVALTGGAFTVFEGSAPLVNSDYLPRPLLDHAGRLVGHVEQKLRASRVVFGRVRHAEFLDVLTTTISDDGQHVAYVTKGDQEQTLVVDGVPSIGADHMSAPVFDGNRRASVAASVGPSIVIVNGSRMRVFENARLRSELAISPDGRFLGLGISTGRRISWRTMDTQSPRNWLDARTAEGRVWTYLRPDQKRLGWYWASRSGGVTFQGREIGGLSVRPGGASILVSSGSPDRGAAMLFVRSSGRNARTFLVNLVAGKASPLGMVGASQVLSWSPDGSYVVVEGRQPRSLVAIDSETAQQFDLAGVLGRSANGLGASPGDVQWSADGALRVRLHTGCSSQVTRSECGAVEEPQRAFALTAKPADRAGEALRLDRPSPPGARDALHTYWRKVSEGDVEAALSSLSSSAQKRMDVNELQVLRALSPLFAVFAGRTTATVKALVVDGVAAHATVDLTLPDVARTDAGRALGREMLSIMFTSAFLPEQEFLEQVRRMIERHAPGLLAQESPLRTTTLKCDMEYEDGRWLMSDNCAALRLWR